MKQIVTYPFSAGGSVLVEVDEGADGGIERVARVGEIVKAAMSFDEAVDVVGKAATVLIQKLRSSSQSISGTLDEIEVEFGIKLGTKAGAVIASAETEANFVVRMVWRPPVASPDT
jgi:hypothetical protein